MVTVSKLGKVGVDVLYDLKLILNESMVYYVCGSCMLTVGKITNNEVIIQYQCYDVLKVQTDIVRIALNSIVLYSME